MKKIKMGDEEMEKRNKWHEEVNCERGAKQLLKARKKSWLIKGMKYKEKNENKKRKKDK